MSIDIKCTKIINIKPNKAGGIIRVDQGTVNFKNNFVFGVISSTSAACFLVTNSTIKLKNTCFIQCAAGGGDCSYGNIGDILTSNLKINQISTLQCSNSTSKTGDSSFRFHTSGVSITSYNSSFCYGYGGSVLFISFSNRSDYKMRYVICSDGANYALLEFLHVALFERFSFINSTKVTSFMLYIPAKSVFDTCYFYMMTNKTRFSNNNVVLKNCCSDEEINSFPLTIYSNIDDAAMPYIRKPLCIGNSNICSVKASHHRLSIFYFIITFLLCLSF